MTASVVLVLVPAQQDSAALVLDVWLDHSHFKLL
jgi:hypothetical protein